MDRLKRHPLARAVRIDKVRLAGLAATLRHYLKGEELTTIPIWRMISTPIEAIESRVERWARSLGGLAEVVVEESVVGGGSLPGSTLPTKLLALKGSRKESKTVQELARRLRCQQPPVVARLEGNRLLLNPRTVLPEEDEALLHAIHSAWKTCGTA
jgi:L-seryl-tRNA(Ser) seleniumtransferase